MRRNGRRYKNETEYVLLRHNVIFIAAALFITLLLAACLRQQEKNEGSNSEKALSQSKSGNRKTLVWANYAHHDTFGEGDTFSSIMKKYAVPGDQVLAVSLLLQKATDMRQVAIGTTLDLNVSDSGIVQMEFTPPRSAFAYHIDRIAHMKFKLSTDTLETDTIPISFAGEIETSLYRAFIAQGATAAMAVKYIEVFQFVHYFSSETRKGDRFRMIIEKIQREGEDIGYGNVIAAQYINEKDTLVAVCNGDRKSKGYGYHFDASGQSLQRDLLCVPFPAARVTSTYGLREHPISGDVTMHHGIDFAAASGTPVVASGDGVITKAEKSEEGLGNWLQIRHGDTGFATRYGHLRSFAKGIKKGAAVKQGQTIGYVGMSGYATGPHLHYEVFRDGQRMNPLKVKGSPVKRLSGAELELFLNRYYKPWVLRLENYEFDTVKETIDTRQLILRPSS